METRGELPAILFIYGDDAPDGTHDQISQALSGHFSLAMAKNREEGRQKMARLGYDAVICHLGQSGQCDPKALSELNHAQPGAPLILLSDMDERELIRAAEISGADDCLRGDEICPVRLPRRLRLAMARHSRQKPVWHELHRYRDLARESPVSIKALDREGRVVFVNSWHLNTFGGGQVGAEFYLGKSIFELPVAQGTGLAPRLRELLQGQPLSAERLHVSRMAGGGSGWINLRGVPLFRHGAVEGAVLIGEDVSAAVRAEKKLVEARQQLERRVAQRTHELQTASETLRRKESDLLNLARKLEEMNAALRFVLEQRGVERKDIEDSFTSHVKRVLVPFLYKLRLSGLTFEQKNYVEVMERSLSQITPPFSRRLSSSQLGLTPKELEVAHLVRDGKTTIEIARLMHITPNAVGFHRKNLRSKLGLTNQKANLRSFLQQMSIH